MAQYEQKYENKNEVKMITEKLKILKDEFKYSKDLLKSTENKIRAQNQEILITEEKCQKIKENIEFKKRNKETPSNSTNPRTTLYSNTSNNEENEEKDIDEQIRNFEMQISAEEKNYKNELHKQSLINSKINDEISLLRIQLKEKDQEIRINDLKLRELKKASKPTPRQQNNMNNNYNENPENNNKGPRINYNSINYRGARNFSSNVVGRPTSAHMNQMANLMDKNVVNNHRPRNAGSKTPGFTAKPFSKNSIKFDRNIHGGHGNNHGNNNNIVINPHNKNNIKFNYNYSKNNTNNNTNNHNTNVNSMNNTNEKERRTFNKDILNNNYEVDKQKNILMKQKEDMINEINSLSNFIFFF